jgi:hypothetical protein
MGVLRLREFRLLFFAQAISWLGDRMVGIALAFAVLSLGGSPAEVGSCSRSGWCRSSRRCSSEASSPTACRAAR